MPWRLMPIVCALFLGMLLAGPAAANWPQWRGPNLNGSAAVGGLPAQLDEAAEVWRIPFLQGAATPIVWGERIFLSGVDGGNLVACALDLGTGRQLWSHTVAPNSTSQRNNLASPSAVTDGKLVVFSYGSGDVLATDLDGNEIWRRNIQRDFGRLSVLHLYSSTPLLWDGRLYIPALHRDTAATPSYVLCVDAATGKDIWRQNRVTSARDETKEAYTTPMPLVRGARRELLILGGDCLTGHNPDTGQELWRITGWNPRNMTNYRIVPSPVIAGDSLIVCVPQRGPVLGFSIPEPGPEPITQTKWQNAANVMTTDAPTPLVYGDKVYVLDGDGQKGIHCIDPATGQRQWYTRFDSPALLRASPTGADGKIYSTNESGMLFVVAMEDGKLLFTRQLQNTGMCRASVVTLEGRVLVRTNTTLYLFGKK
jgi:outer membrane protein assembly factor BamB